MSTSKQETEAPIVINGINIAITPALDEHVHKKLGKVLSKFSGAVQECDVVLSVSKNPKVRNVFLSTSPHIIYNNNKT